MTLIYNLIFDPDKRVICWKAIRELPEGTELVGGLCINDSGMWVEQLVYNPNWEPVTLGGYIPSIDFGDDWSLKDLLLTVELTPRGTGIAKIVIDPDYVESVLGTPADIVTATVEQVGEEKIPCT
jgi:hypothetical protein